MDKNYKDFPIVKLFIGWTMLPAKMLISLFPYKWPRRAMAKQALCIRAKSPPFLDSVD